MVKLGEKLKLVLNLVIFFIFFLLTSPSNYGPGNDFFSCTSSRKIKFWPFWIQKAQIALGCLTYSQRNVRNSNVSFSVHKHFSYVFQNVCPQFCNISGFVFFKFVYENTYEPRTIWACWIHKSLNFVFLEDVHEKKWFPGW